MKEAEREFGFLVETAVFLQSAFFTRSDEGYFGCGYAASFNRVGNVPRVDGETGSNVAFAWGVSHTFIGPQIAIRAKAKVSGMALAAGRAEIPAASAVPLTTASTPRASINLRINKHSPLEPCKFSPSVRSPH